MLRQTTAQIVTYQFESLPGDRLGHALFTRLGGVSRGPFRSLNVGHSVGDDPSAVAENHARIYAHLELSPAQVATARQVHGNRVQVVGAAEAGQALPATDGLITNVPGIALMLRLADCQPILLYDPEHHALALLHAGWRGAAQGIAHRAVEAMQDAFGSRPDSLVAGLGPAIGPCCYRVGDDVAAAMGYALPDWRRVLGAWSPDGDAPGEGGEWRLDLPGANAQQLAAAGVRQIELSGLCTACHTDEFYSHRAENGRTGRFAAVAWLKARTGGRAQAEARGEAPETEGGGCGAARSLHAPGLPAFAEMFRGEP